MNYFYNHDHKALTNDHWTLENISLIEKYSC